MTTGVGLSSESPIVVPDEDSHRRRHKTENEFGRLKLSAGLELRNERNPNHFD